MCSAHHLSDEGDLGVVQNDVKIVYDAIGKGAVGEVTQVENIFDIDLISNVGFDHGFVGCQNFSRAAADCAEAEKSDVQHNMETSDCYLQMCISTYIIIITQLAQKCKQNIKKP